MPGKLRVFISSTMDDMVNERDMVVARLVESNFEPVNAESILPDGGGAWTRISEEIETCHAFILLSGERYGWIPRSGPLSAKNISVTHGEYLAACELNLPILPFFKDLKYETDATNDDARRRDAFRKKVGDWEGGQFRTMFKTARDLADKAVAAITRMLTDTFQRAQVAQRRAQARTLAPPIPPAPAGPPLLPPNLSGAVADGCASFWAGSGISQSAGLPSASALGIEMARSIEAALGRYAAPPVGSGIASVASDFEIVLGRPLLLDKLRELLSLPGGVKPTLEHFAAVALFPRIVTTNYDGLFECAAEEQHSGHTLLLGPKPPSPLPEKFIWKIHGDPDRSDVLVVNEADIERFEGFAPELVACLRVLFSGGPLLVGGTSLRDPSVLRLFRALRGEVEGYWTVPPGDALAQKRSEELALWPIEGRLEDVLQALRGAKSH